MKDTIYKVIRSTGGTFSGKKLKGELKPGIIEVFGTSETFKVDKINKTKDGVFILQSSNITLYVRKI